MQIHVLKGFNFFFFFFAQEYFKSIDRYLSNSEKVASSRENFYTFYSYYKSSTRCSSIQLQLYYTDNLMNFYRLSIKSFKATKLFIDIIRYVKDTKERIGCVQTFYLSNDPQIYMFRKKYYDWIRRNKKQGKSILLPGYNNP